MLDMRTQQAPGLLPRLQCWAWHRSSLALGLLFCDGSPERFASPGAAEAGGWVSSDQARHTLALAHWLCVGGCVWNFPSSLPVPSEETVSLDPTLGLYFHSQRNV